MRKIDLVDFLLGSPVVYHSSKQVIGTERRKNIYSSNRKWRLLSDNGEIVFKDTVLYYCEGELKFKTDNGFMIILANNVAEIYELKPYEKVKIQSGTFSGNYDFLIRTKDGKEIFIGGEEI